MMITVMMVMLMAIKNVSTGEDNDDSGDDMVMMVMLKAIKNVLTGEDNDKDGDDNYGENNYGAKY